MPRPPALPSRPLRATFVATAFVANLALGALVDTLATPEQAVHARGAAPATHAHAAQVAAR